MNEEIKPENMRIHSRADELIACLEGEIAKRDARIVELELEVALRDQALDRHAEYGKQLRAELAAIKAQEPVAYIPVDRETGEEWHPVLKKGSGNICDYKPLYAAPAAPAADAWVPVSERLPEPNTKVLVHGPKCKHFFALRKNRQRNFWEFLDGNTCNEKITHWTPLPAAPAANSAKGVV